MPAGYLLLSGPFFSFESYNRRGNYIRHAFGFGEISPIPDAENVAKEDSTFEIVKALETRSTSTSTRFQMSFRSFNRPDSYLRHQDGRLKLHQRQEISDNLLADASFKIVPGLADPQWISFESVNYPNKYIRHREGHLWVEPATINPQVFKQDATFKIVVSKANPRYSGIEVPKPGEWPGKIPPQKEGQKAGTF